jgi:hypothetical protein
MGGLEGQHANFGHPEVQDSFISLLGKLAKRYDMDLRLSFIQFTETAISATVTPGQQNNFIDGVIDMNRQAACIFYRTPLIQSINFPRSRLSDLVAGMTTHRLGLGGPDVFFGSFNDPKNSLAFVSSSAPGVYHYHPHVAGVLPIGMQVHRENLLYVTREEQLAEQPHGLSPSESVRAVHDFALQKLEPNYLVWHVFGTSDPYRQALEAILSMNASPLSLSCPQVYASRCSSGRVGTRQKRN